MALEKTNLVPICLKQAKKAKARSYAPRASGHHYAWWEKNWEEKGKKLVCLIWLFPHKNSTCGTVSCHSSFSSSIIISLRNSLPSSEYHRGEQGGVCLFFPIRNAPAVSLSISSLLFKIMLVPRLQIEA